MLKRILSFFFMLQLIISRLFGLPTLNNYSSKLIIDGSEFENGFSVVSMEAPEGQQQILGDFSYPSAVSAPTWTIAQWSSKYCLWDERAESDDYTITDGKTKWLSFNPAEKYVSMRLNAANVYEGQPADEGAWPHLLLEQSPLKAYENLSEQDKAFYGCDADRMVFSLDARISDFKDTTNSEGINAVQYLAFFYVRSYDGQHFIWFGVNLFDSRGLQPTYWSLDTAGSNNMIYAVSTNDSYGSALRSLYRFGKPHVSNDWTKLRLDLSPHLDSLFEKMNESGDFGGSVDKSDFYISGVNIGFEVHGNYDCTVDIKDLALTSYIKK